MKTWMVAVVLLMGCGTQTIEEAPKREPEPEPVVESQSPRKVRTICADEIAIELDPTLNEMLGDALLYWQGEPGADQLRAGDTGDCDVPVYFSDESRWKGTQGARAFAVGEPDNCTPKRLELREAEWGRVTANDWTFVVVAHEVGHLLCKHHESSGIMAPDGGLTD